MKNQDFPYSFDEEACSGCGGRCCRGLGGYVWLSKEELKQLAGARKMEIPVFVKQYVRQVEGKLSLRERVINGEHLCCFFDHIAARCMVYENRPKQCQTFPFWDKFKDDYGELFLECSGLFLK